MEAATMTTATADCTITSILAAGIGFVIEALISEDIPLACNLLSQMVTTILYGYYCYHGYRVLVSNSH